MRELVAVAVGALAGSALRLGIDTVIPHTDAGFPVSTLVINLVGSLALGFLIARVWPRVPGWLRAGLGAGLVGTFTTFSAFAVSLVTLAAADELGLALAYLAATVVGGLATAFVGLTLGARSGGRSGGQRTATE